MINNKNRDDDDDDGMWVRMRIKRRLKMTIMMNV